MGPARLKNLTIFRIQPKIAQPLPVNCLVPGMTKGGLNRHDSMLVACECHPGLAYIDGQQGCRPICKNTTLSRCRASESPLAD